MHDGKIVKFYIHILYKGIYFIYEIVLELKVVYSIKYTIRIK